MTFSNRMQKRDLRQCVACGGDLNLKGECLFPKCIRHKKKKRMISSKRLVR